MKYFIRLIFCLGLLPVTLHAQNFTGYAHSEMEPAGGVFANPASIAGTRYKADINVLSGNLFLSNNAIGYTSLFHIFSSGDYTPLNNNNPKQLYANMDVFLPSFTIALDNTQSIGITSRLRMLASETGMSDELLRFMVKDTNIAPNKNLIQSDTYVNLHKFMDVGISYARIITKNNEHTLKAGATAKLYLGIAAGALQMRNGSFQLMGDQILRDATGTIDIAYSDGFDDIYDGNYWSLKPDAFGFGVDLGIVYEWKKPSYRQQRWKTPYTFRLGISVTDWGIMKYPAARNAATYALNLHEGVNYYNLFDLGLSSLSDYLDYMKAQEYLTEETHPATFSAGLPTYMRIQADYNIYSGLYVNLFVGINLKSNQTYGATYANIYTLSPRWEQDDFSVYMPVGYTASRQINWGMGINLNYFFIGSGSIFSGLLSKNVAAIDVYCGIHIPLGDSQSAEAIKKKWPKIVKEKSSY